MRPKTIRCTREAPGASHVQSVVPFASGEWRGEPLSDGGRLLEVIPFGADWPDGSHRYGLLRSPLPEGTDLITVGRPYFAGGPFPFTTTAGMVAARGSLGFGIGPRDHSPVVARNWEAVEQTGEVIRWRSIAHDRARYDLVLTTTLEFRSGSDVALWRCGITASAPGKPEANYEIGPLYLHLHAPIFATIEVWHEDRHEVEKVGPGTLRIDLGEAGTWGDGQTLTVSGTLDLFNGTWARGVAEADDWRHAKALGPFGEIPDLEGVDWTPASTLYGKHEGHPWESPVHGVEEDPSATGNQNDAFGPVSCLTLLGPNGLAYYHGIERSLGLNSCRPTHTLDHEGRPWDFPPESGVVLYSGKADPRFGPLPFGKTEKPRGRDGWDGRDPEHYSITSLVCFYLLTGEAWAREEVEHSANVWLASAPRFPSRNIASARDAGRVLLSGAYLYLATGRTDIRDALAREVFKAVEARRRTTGLEPMQTGPGFIDHKGHANAFGDGVPFGAAWMDSIEAMGLEAAGRILDDSTAKVTAHSIARFVVSEAVWKAPNGSLLCAYQYSFEDGEGRSEVRQRKANTAFLEWCQPAAKIAPRDGHADDIVDLFRDRTSLSSRRWGAIG